ncbi:ABC-type transport auxiliary lipoprotein family protein [Ideonella sp. A 288]|uniref:ABC-type transport auxiliary lipoprotein family protein n=1 Tax=Ideonella sp. A 288 TaxID=1962181 RepID=UPI000B4B27CB|nr:ABC-type transport auxiliary lipoprotein family protein [Ideonella sp. A 288]
MNAPLPRRIPAPWLALLVAALATGCAGMLPKPPPAPPAFYALDSAPALSAGAAALTARTAATLVVDRPHAAAGFDSSRIVYQRAAHRLETYAHSEWVDAPARMLAPLLVSALQRSGGFGHVVSAPTPASGDLRLDTEVVQLTQVFGAGPSQIRLTLRATLVDQATRRVLAWREFDVTEPAPSDDAPGGVAAANRAVQAVLQALVAWCGDAAAPWRPPR